ncbi:MAG TPA: DUF2807 domain-containing protein [Bacteroidia bacterium]|nr:DUF2807 domain-containing protein [Bacteroidia bacterium]
MIEIKGDGNIVSREFSVSSFIRLHISGKGLIELHQSEEEKVIVETDENLLDCFDIVNSGRTLYVSAECKFRKAAYTKCTIRIYLRQVDVLYVRNEGATVVCPDEIVLLNPIEIKVQSQGDTELYVNAPAIKILSQTQGDVTLKGRCGKMEIKNQSQGNFNSREMKAEHLIIKNMAEGNVDLFASKEITISHFGQGTVRYWGEAVLKDVKQYGDGRIAHQVG